MPLLRPLALVLLGGGLAIAAPASARLDPFAPVPPGRLIIPTPTPGTAAAANRSEPLPPPPPPGGGSTPRPAGKPAVVAAPALDRYQLEALMTENGRLRILLSDRKTGELISTALGARLPGTGITVIAASQGSNPSVTLSQGGASRRLGL